MAIQMRERWTDERLDDLNAKVDDLARRMDAGFEELRSQIAEQGGQLHGRIDQMQRTILLVGASIVAALLTVFATLLAIVLTQL